MSVVRWADSFHLCQDSEKIMMLEKPLSQDYRQNPENQALGFRLVYKYLSITAAMSAFSTC